MKGELKSSASLSDLAEAMRAAGIGQIEDPEKRQAAIQAALLKLMGQTLLDPSQRVVCRGARLLNEAKEELARQRRGMLIQ